LPYRDLLEKLDRDLPVRNVAKTVVDQNVYNFNVDGGFEELLSIKKATWKL
jgi:hypothetical protein